MVSVEFTEEEARLTQAALVYLSRHLVPPEQQDAWMAENKLRKARAEPEPEKPKRGRPRKQTE